VRAHFHSIVRRWMDPNGDGNPEDGIDGWRVDVAAEVPLGFWREFRGWVQAINSQAYITGEIWWDDYAANTFRNARPWLDQAFDGVMNYRFGDAVFQFLNQPRCTTPAQFAEALELQHQQYGYDRCLALQNLLGSHDTSRVGSAVVNPSARQDHGASLKDDRGYDPRAPNAAEKSRWRQMIALQFLAPGAPYLYYGDEAGMWGADDPDCRKPMVWSDLRYAPEKCLPSGGERAPDPVSVDREQWRFFRDWIRFRKEHPALRRGDYRTLTIANHPGVLAFERRWQRERIIALFNSQGTPVRINSSDLGIEDLRRWKVEPAMPSDSRTIEIPANHYRILLPR
jgi:glycosidase